METIVEKIEMEMEWRAQVLTTWSMRATRGSMGEETKSNEERRLKRSKWKLSGAQGQGQDKEKEIIWVQSPKRRRERIAENGRLLPKGTTAMDVHQRPKRTTRCKGGA
jgi:hypothetical protein